MEAAPFALKVRMLQGRGDRNPAVRVRNVDPRQEESELRTAHHRFLLRIIGFHCRQRTDHLMSYAKALTKAQCESVETSIRKRRLPFAGGVQRRHNERLIRRMTFGTMAGGENPGPGRPEKNWAQCLVDDLRVFRATEGSTESFQASRWCLESKRCYGPRRLRRVGSGIGESSKRRNVS